ncbi:dihydrofolate reductase [Chloroflexia bacterium SDU3-3]|nr:dihydrofolate reductase [Chloroflexia bacterium SDU3-3]
MRKLIYYVACSADGFIARSDGSYDYFLFDGEHFNDLITRFPETFPAPAWQPMGISGPNKLFDTVLMGRETYEAGLPVGLTSPYPQLRQYVFSRSMAESLDPQVTLVSDGAEAFVAALKQEDGMAIWLCGGSKLAATLLPQIDELILKVNPVLIGQGRPLFDGKATTIGLKLLESKPYANGFVLQRYALEQRA